MPPEEFNKLWTLGKDIGVGVHTYVNDEEGVVARSWVTATKDEAGRRGTRNHTIIVKKPSNKELVKRINGVFETLRGDMKLANPLPEITI